MIADLLPPEVASAELFHDVDEASLYPEERIAIGNAVSRRRREFATGRVCARRALAALGLPPEPIPRGKAREPVWPGGVVGSIAHCAGYRAAAAARAADIGAVGIDVEPFGPLPVGVLSAIALPDEEHAVNELRSADPAVHWDRLMFCAKEAFYKAFYPSHERLLRFTDVHVTLQPTTGIFCAHLVQTTHVNSRTPDGFSGQWLVRNNLIVTAITESAKLATSPDR